MLRIFTAASLLAVGCMLPVNETPIGRQDPASGGGGGGGGDGSGGHGPSDGGGAGTTEAACDQSTCLPISGRLSSMRVFQLAQDDASFYAVAGLPTSAAYYDTALFRFDKKTGLRTLLANGFEVDPKVPLRVADGQLYLGYMAYSEIFGMLARVPTQGGQVERITTESGGGSPGPVVYDLINSTPLWADANKIYTLPTMTSNPDHTYFTNMNAITDLRTFGDDIFFTDEQAVVRIANGSTTTLALGNFQRVIAGVINGELRVFAAGTLAGQPEPGIYDVTLPNEPRFLNSFVPSYMTIGRGQLFFTSLLGKEAIVHDASGTEVLRAPHDTIGFPNMPPTVVVDDTHIWLGTTQGLFYSSMALPTATCGCALPRAQLDTSAPACARNLCMGNPLNLRGYLYSGAVNGGRLFGAHYDPTATDVRLYSSDLSSGTAISYSDVERPTVVTADATHLYFMDSVGDVSRIAREGGARLTLAGGGRTPQHRINRGWLAVDSTHVYFHGAQGLTRVLKAGGAEQVLTAAEEAWDIKLDATYVYFVEHSKLRRVPLGGGSPFTLAEGFEDYAGYALDATHVYFTTSRGLERIRKTGGFKSLLAPWLRFAALSPRYLEVQDADLLFVAEAQGVTSLYRLPIAEGPPEPLLRLDANETFYNFIADAKGYAFSGAKGTRWQERGCDCE